MTVIRSDRPDVQYRVTVRDMPSDERPRERLLKYGAVTLQTAELLAIILRVGTQGENVIELAARLLRDHGGLGGLLTVDAALLSAEHGMGEAKTSQLKAALELGRRLSSLTPGGRSQITSPTDVANLIGNVNIFLTSACRAAEGILVLRLTCSRGACLRTSSSI